MEESGEKLRRETIQIFCLFPTLAGMGLFDNFQRTNMKIHSISVMAMWQYHTPHWVIFPSDMDSLSEALIPFYYLFDR